MSEENPEDPKKYDPRIAYEWVPMYLACIFASAAVFMAIVPWIGALIGDNEMVGLAASIMPNETYNYLLISLVSFWLGKKSIDKENKP